MARNDDPRAPWNQPGRGDDPREPWNHPQHEDDPRAPWNNPGSYREDSMSRHDTDYRKRRSYDDEYDW